MQLYILPNANCNDSDEDGRSTEKPVNPLHSTWMNTDVIPASNSDGDGIEDQLYSL